MPSFLIEVRQESDLMARKQIEDSIRTLGSHFATHAKWRRKAGMCTGTMAVEADDTGHALGAIPPNMRAHAHVHQLNTEAAA